MATTNKWIGNATGNVGNANHGPNWSLGIVPTAAHEVECGPDALAAMTSGLTAFAATLFVEFRLLRSCAFPIGFASNPFQVQASLLRIDSSPAVEHVIQVMNAAAAPTLIENAGKSLTLSGKVDLTQGMKGGVARILTGSTVAAGAVVQGGALVIDSGSTTSGFTVEGGDITSASNLGDVTVLAGGTVTTTGAATAGTCQLKNGARWYHGSTGAITSMTAKSGATFDGSASTGYTMTTLAMDGDANVTPGAQCVITNPVQMLSTGRGPRVFGGTTLAVVTPGGA